MVVASRIPLQGWISGAAKQDKTLYLLTKLSPTRPHNSQIILLLLLLLIFISLCVCVSIKMAVCFGSSSSSGVVIGVVLIFALMFAIVVEAQSPAPAPAPTSDGIILYTSFFLSLPFVDPKSLLFFLFGCSKCSLRTHCFPFFNFFLV